MRSVTSLILGAAAGAAAAHFLDPDAGARRRGQLRDQAVSKARGRAAQAAGSASALAARAQGAAVSAMPSMPGRGGAEALDDVSLARKVETEIFRDADAPKGAVSVNAEDGVVFLRGQVDDPEWIARLARSAGAVDGVKDVRNLLHRPGTPSPST